MGQLIGSSSNIPIGKLVKDHVQLTVGQNYLITGDLCFPKFYYDYGNHARQIDEWFSKIKFSKANKCYPFPPAILIDASKTGKSAFMRRFLPHLVLKSFPNAKIIHIDLLDIPMRESNDAAALVAPVQFEYFGHMLFYKLADGLRKIGFKIGVIGNVKIEMAIMRVFEQLNTWLAKKRSICFMLWDNVQRWFMSIPSYSATGLFNAVTLHKAFTNIAFVITGSHMAQVFKAVLDFPENWALAAHCISLYPRDVDESRAYYDQRSNITIASQHMDSDIVQNMVKTLRVHHGNAVCPENILEIMPESTPADIAHFCSVYAKQNSRREPETTIGKYIDTRYQEFCIDLFPVIKDIATTDTALFQVLMQIASARVTIDELDLVVLGKWAPLFTALLRVDRRDENTSVADNPRVCFAGRYGKFMIRRCMFDNLS